MTEMKVETGYAPPLLRLAPEMELGDERLFEFCRANRKWRIERTEDGDLKIMPPTGGRTGNRNLNVVMQLGNWTERDGRGVAFDPSTGFLLPGGAMRSPNASWVRRELLSSLTENRNSGSCPSARTSPSGYARPRINPPPSRRRCANTSRTARLSAIIDSESRRVYIYRPRSEVEVLESPRSVTGDPLLPGLTPEMRRVWEPGF